MPTQKIPMQRAFMHMTIQVGEWMGKWVGGCVAGWVET
jgi:hypothetical protein